METAHLSRMGRIGQVTDLAASLLHGMNDDALAGLSRSRAPSVQNHVAAGVPCSDSGRLLPIGP